jgi:hypothetical protein
MGCGLFGRVKGKTADPVALQVVHAPLDLRCLQNQSDNDAVIDKLIRSIAVRLRYDSHNPCTLVLQAGASYPTCGRGVGSPIIALASKPEMEISAPLPHALLIRPDGILGRITPDPAYKVDEQQTLPSTSCKHLRVHGNGPYRLAWH